MLGALRWTGQRAQWVLAFGVIGALFVPGPGSLLAGTVPFWVAFLFALAMTRIDLGMVARRAIGPQRLLRNLGLVVILMVVTPSVFWAIATLGGLDEGHIAAVVYTGSGPPLGSAAAFCFLLGFDAAFAIELTVLGSVIAPISMPLMARLLLGENVPIETAEMMLRLGLLIGAASLGAVVARRLIGAKTIERQRQAFDGLAAIVLVVFLFPLFDGMLALIIAVPLYALTTIVLACFLNLGVQIATLPLCWRIGGRETGGATALVWGNRNAALSLAVLPENLLFTLFIALYQFPMYFTPLVIRPVANWLEARQRM